MKIGTNYNNCLKYTVFFIIGIASMLILLRCVYLEKVYAAPVCNATQEHPRSILSYTPTEGMVGQTVSITACGCCIDGTVCGWGYDNLDIFLRNQDNQNIKIYGQSLVYGDCLLPIDDYTSVTAQFNLVGAPSGYYDVIISWQPPSPPAFSPYHEVVAETPFNVFTSSIIGWGWFGTSTGTPATASPGWESLTCHNAYPDEKGSCSDVGGIDYGIGLAYSEDEYPIIGQGWLGETEDEDTNPANDAPVGWVTYDPVELIWPTSQVPGTVDGPVIFHNDTGIVEGWGRINTLKQYGQSLSCTTPLYRNWTETRLATTNSTNIKMAQSSDGALHVVWKNNTTNKIYYRQFRSGIWTSPLVLSDISLTTNNTKPDISIDANDIIHVSYIYGLSPKLHHIACEYTDTSQCWWDDDDWWIDGDILPPSDPTLNKLNQSIISDSNNLYMFYEGTTDLLNPNHEGIYYSRADQYGAGWSVPVLLSGENAHTPDSAIDYQNNLYVVWKEGNAIKYREGDGDPTVWDETVELTDSGNNPQIAVDAGNPIESNPRVVYEKTIDIYYRYYTETGGWMSESNISNVEATQTATEPSINIGNDYRVHVVYRISEAGANDIRHIETFNNQIWSSPKDITNFIGLTSHIKPTALVDFNNQVRVISESDKGLTITNSTDLICGNPGAWGTDWGWLSMRGGIVDPVEIGPMGSCYGDEASGGCDPATLSCKVCEVDFDYYIDPDLDNPPIYACNTCTKCGYCQNDPAKYCSPATADADCGIVGAVCKDKKVCRRSGTDCSNGESCELMSDPNNPNTCTAVCEQCAICNLWGVSAVGDVEGDEGVKFHGYGWSAGGTTAVYPDYPAGSYDSGKIDITWDIGSGPGYPPNQANCEDADGCQCTTAAICTNWGWNVSDNPAPTNTQICSSINNVITRHTGVGAPDIYGWGTCQARSGGGLNPELTYSKELSDAINEAGNYFISLSSVYSSNNNEKARITLIDGDTGEEIVLDAVDLSAAPNGTVASCTFYQQVYLSPNDKLRFSSFDNNSLVELDSFRITKLPVYPVDCATGNSPTTAYVDEVGFGYVDFSQVASYQPWTQTRYGDIYARGQIGPGGEPPSADLYSSDYIIETPGGYTIEGWTVNLETCDPLFCTREEGGSTIVLPSPDAGYKNLLGRIDYRGITKPQGENQYSDTVLEFNSDNPIPSRQCGSGTINWSVVENDIMPDGFLRKGIYHFGKEDEYCSLIINDAISFENGLQATDNGSGLFIIEGDLVIEENIIYGAINPIEVVSQLASVGWIVKGDVIIDGTVSNLVGAYAVIGCETGGNCIGPAGSHGGAFVTGISTEQLILNGLILAKEYNLQRTYAGAEGSELFRQDGRLQANPPPGTQDIAKNIPIIKAIKP